MKKATIESAITERFLEVMADSTGPGKRFKYKKDFAKAMGILQQELYKIERSIASVQLRHLFKIEELTGVNLNWIVCGKGEKYDERKSTAFNGLEERVGAIEKIVLKYLAK